MVILMFLLITPNTVLSICPEPDPVVNSYRFKDDNFLEEGSWLNYTCYMNYFHYSGDINRQCSNGNFTGLPPVCIYSCGPPPYITSMIPDTPDLTIPGSIVNYYCQFNSSIKLTAVCDTDIREWVYNDAIICPQPGNLFQTLMHEQTLEGWASLFYDNNTETCRQSAMSTQPTTNFTHFETVDVQSISVTFGVMTGARGPIIVKLVSPMDQSNTTCGAIIEDLHDNETIVIQCSPPAYGTVIGISMVLEANMTGLIRICEFSTVGNVRNESCHGQPSFIYGAGIISRNGDKIVLQCIPSFYWLANFEVVRCREKKWARNFMKCAHRDELIPIQAYDIEHSYVFDQSMDTCKPLENVTIMGSAAQNRTLIISSITIGSLDFNLNGVGVKAIKSNGESSEFYFTTSKRKMILCDFDDYVEANTIVFHANSTSTGVHRLCELYVAGYYKDTNDYECFRNHPSNYQGKMNFTWNDLSCNRWDKIPPILNFNLGYLPDDSVTDAQNYCRNPDNSASVPWCFVKNYTERAKCMVQPCKSYCSLSSDGKDYTGQLSTTSSEGPCVNWNEVNDSNKIDEFTQSKQCKNAGDGYSRPWCFTDLSGQSFGACDIIHCAKTINHIYLNKPSMLSEGVRYPYCYWNNDTFSKYIIFSEQYGVILHQSTLQARCLDGVKSVFCYGNNDESLTHYFVKNCDSDTTVSSAKATSLFSTVHSSFTNIKKNISKVTSSIPDLNLPELPFNLSDERCTCLCVETDILDTSTLNERIEDIIVSLRVEKSNLTSVVRRKTSAQDKRPSVVYIGSGAVAIFTVFILVVISPDIIYFVKTFQNIIKTCKKYERA